MITTQNIPQISIVITTYNRANYIAETIESIRKQTFTDWELLIMDNGSEDETKKIVESINDSRIQYYYYEPTTTGRLRNIAFSKAKGEYLSFMDSDDLWLEDKLERQMKLLQANSGIRFSFTNSYDFTGNKEIVAAYNPITEGILIKNIFNEFIDHKLKPTIQSFLFHKSCLDVAGRFYETRIFNDYRFIGNLVYHFDAAVIHEPLLLRRLHNTNSIDVYSDELADEYIEAMISFRDNNMLDKSRANNKLLIAYINGGNNYLNSRKWQQAITKYLLAWQACPFSIIPLKKIVKTILQYLRHKLFFENK